MSRLDLGGCGDAWRMNQKSQKFAAGSMVDRLRSAFLDALILLGACALAAIALAAVVIAAPVAALLIAIGGAGGMRAHRWRIAGV